GGLGHAPASSDIGTPEALFLRAQLLLWFDHWLKGIDNGITNEPRVTVTPERTAAWSETSLITADTFPLPGTVMKTYFFNRLKLSTRASAGGRRVTIQPTTGVPALLRPIQNALGGDAADLIAAVTVVNGILNSGGDFHDHAATFNTPHEIDFSPFGINHVFKAGNKIMVHVTSRDFPFFLPNFSQPKIRIYRDSQHPSNVALPVVP